MTLSAGLDHPLGIWAYLAIAVLVIIEGPIATLVGAVAASAGYLKPGWVFVFAAAGNLTSDTLWYLLGYLGNIEWLVKYGRYVGLKREQVVNLQKEIEQHALQILFVAKLTLGFVIPVLIATGLARIPLRRWFGVLVSAEFIWTGGLVYVGYHFGRYVRTLERGIQFFTLGAGLVFAILTIRFITKRRARAAEIEEITRES
ncbi:MAG: VTT domain-containing protein [Anaerolineaceae bacterium]|nr:VTT domain-containing protein [Anaerolineaceae bacterium]